MNQDPGVLLKLMHWRPILGAGTTRSNASNFSAVRKGRKRFQEAQLLITSLFRVYALQNVVLPNGLKLQIRNRTLAIFS
jgi:hypothetical protein